MTDSGDIGDAEEGNPYGVTLYPIETPSGSALSLQTPEEADWYSGRRDRYLTDNVFTNVSDLMDLDRLLMLEVLGYRWGLWMAQGFDYQFARIDENQMKTNIRDYSVEIRMLKQSLGIDKATRDKSKGESLSDYTEKLLERAKAFGYHRNMQYETAVTLFWQLRSFVMTYERTDDEERTLLDISHTSVFEWIRDTAIPQWDEIDASFRKQQAIWIKEM